MKKPKKMKPVRAWIIAYENKCVEYTNDSIGTFSGWKKKEDVEMYEGERLVRVEIREVERRKR